MSSIRKSVRYLAAVLSMPAIQSDQQFIQTMIIQGRKKRKLEDEENIPQTKVRRVTVKNEPEQVIEVEGFSNWLANDSSFSHQ